MSRNDILFVPTDFSDALRKIRERTPARILVGRSGAAYRTPTHLDLREAHAAARDAVRAELDLETALGAEFIKKWDLFEISTEAASKDEYLQVPERGRRLTAKSRQELRGRCKRGCDIQFAIGDGLSVSAVSAQIPVLLPLLHQGAQTHGWTTGNSFVIRHCRVGVLNDIGEILTPKVVVLLIGERPGLATAESLSAYMAYQPGALHTDANRNLIPNIHARGLDPKTAADRILNLVERMMTVRNSGFNVREDSTSILGDRPTIHE